jgi:zona occludens toxin
MAITAIVGRPGHGKSYSATDLAIVPALQEGRAVYTNIPLRDEAISRDFPDARVHYVKLDQEELNDPSFWEFSPGALVILDELWRVWPSGLKANRIPIFQLAFIKEHRHRTDDQGRWQDIVLVTQNLADIAAAIREMCETTVICSQLQDMGAAGWFIREYYTGPIKGCDGGPSEKMVNNERIKYEDKVYQYYVSNTQGTNKSAGPQGAKVVKQTIWGGWKAKAAAVILIGVILAVPFLTWKTTKNLDKLKDNAKAKPTQTDPTPPVLTPQPASIPTAPPPPIMPPPMMAPPEPIKPTEPQPSKAWRVSGYTHIPDSPDLVHITDGKLTRRVPFDKFCKKETDIECQINGEIVARWTGSDSIQETRPIQPLATIAPNPLTP